MRYRTKPVVVALLASGLLFNPTRGEAQALFSDNFDTDSSASWSIFDGVGTGPSDYTAQFAFDYSVHGIPAAPNSTGGTTKGLKLTVNKDDTAATAAVSLYPASMAFFGDYSLKFDMWMAYNGGAFGGDGSTENATFGLNHIGDKVNWTVAPNSDGVWFTVCGEAGAARDYRAYVGEPNNAAIELLQVDGGFLDRDGDGEREVESAPDVVGPLDLMFPTPPFETRGAPGKQWVQVEVRQRGGVVTWIMNGYVIAEHANLNNFVSGNVMLGYMDIFSSIANPKAQNFVIYDNVRVEDLTTATALPVVGIVASDASAAEPSDTGTFTVSRTGDTSSSLTIGLRATGTASNGVDYVSIPLSVTIPAGASETNITLTPINDQIGEGPETATLSLVGNPALFEVRENVAATIELADDGDKPFASIFTNRPVAYESIAALKGQFSIRLSNPNAADSTVSYTIGGTATGGVHYVALPGSVVIPAGTTNALIDIVPINNALIDTNRTVVLTLVSNAAYTLGAASNATVVVRNDDLPAASGIFSDNFDTDSSGAWIINKANANTFAEFGYDYSLVGVPPAPTSTNTTRGLKLYSSAAAFTGLSVSPTGQSFPGDIRMRFDMWINYNGPLDGGGSGSTEAMSFGVNTSGTNPQWAGANVDSAMFAVTGDGGSASDYRAYLTNTLTAPGSGFYAAGTQTAARNQTDPYYAEFGRESAPTAQLNLNPGQVRSTLVGAVGMAWHDVVVEKRGTNISWFIDGLRIATMNTTGVTFPGNNIFLGYFDTANGAPGDPSMVFGLVDNLRIESLGLPRPVITAIRNASGSVEIDFTAQAPGAPESFTVVSASTVNGPFTTDAGASIALVSGNQFRATVPASGDTRFYMIVR